MAALGAINANRQQKQQKQQNLAAAEHNRYANWTGRTMQQRFDAPDALGGALQGGVSGLGMAQGLGSVFGGGADAAAKATAGAKLNTLYGQGANVGVYGGGTDHAGGMNPYGAMLGNMGPKKTFAGY
jgi:hypothetical protein